MAKTSNKLTWHLFALLLLAVFTPFARAAEPETMSWNVSGVERHALVYAPTTLTKHLGSPLVFVFHGHGGNMRNIARTMPIQNVWPEAIVVYPQGVPTPTKIDPDGKKDGWQRSPGDQGDRDVRFFDAILISMHKKFAVNDKRIYVTGFSNGGVFTYVLWAMRPNVFAAVAPCAGLPLPGLHLEIPKPAFIVAGVADPIVKIENQQAMIEEVRKLDGATNAGKSGDNGVVLYDSDKRAPVQTLIHTGGHVLPSQAANQIADFFRAHELGK